MSRSTVQFLVALLVAWLLQGIASFWQARRFYGRIQKLRASGRCAVGVSGSIYKTKAYGVLVVDGTGRIVRAEKLTGFTIFAQLRPVDQLVGRTLSDLLSGPIKGLSPKVHNAFKMAAETLLKGSEPEDKPGSEAAIATTGLAAVSEDRGSESIAGKPEGG